MTDLHAVALAWHDAGRKVAIATVVETWGSAPRGVGSILVIAADGAMEGSVSGGCVEGAVITEAMDALASGTTVICNYGVSDDDAFAVGLACGGRIRVVVEPIGAVMPVDVLRALVAARGNRQPVALVSSLSKGAHRIVPSSDYPDRAR
ncbi:MAG: XdhC family protein, partial [Yoonia sp.]